MIHNPKRDIQNFYLYQLTMLLTPDKIRTPAAAAPPTLQNVIGSTHISGYYLE